MTIGAARTYEDTMSTIEKILRPGPFVLGDQFSFADLYLAAQLGWSLQFKTIEARPIFVDYVKLCQSRPAARRADEQAEAIAAKVKTGQ